MEEEKQPENKPPEIEPHPIPKKPNVLNNLLRRLRQQAFPERSIAYAAKKMGIKPAYLVKVESGNLEKPNDETFAVLLKWYCTDADWAKTLTYIKELAKAGELHSDDMRMGVDRSARLNPDGKEWIVIFGPGYILRSVDEIFTGATRTYVSVECLVSLLVAVPGSAPVLASKLKTAGMTVAVVGQREASSVLHGHDQVICVEDTLLAFGGMYCPWTISADESFRNRWLHWLWTIKRNIKDWEICLGQYIQEVQKIKLSP